MSGQIRQPVSPAVIVLAVLALLSLRQLIWPPRPAPRLAHALPATVTIADVTPDGTLIADRWGPLRLLGIGIPVAARDAAQAFLVAHCAGQGVRLEWDRHRQTRDGTPVAFVFVDDVCINEQLLEAGLARFDDAVLLRRDMQRRLQAAEQTARRAGRGLWEGQPHAERGR